MAELVLVLAKTGTGKSSSMRNLKKDEVGVVSVSGKRLPFKHDLNVITPKNYEEVYQLVNKSTSPIIVIDDANYLLSFEEMARVGETGYGKFTQMANNMFRLFRLIAAKPGDQVFYIMAHAADTEDGTLRIKTTGKMLSEKIVLEGLVNIVITTEVHDGEFVFRVQTDGSGVKTPLGMFEEETIPNDLKIVDTAVREFYGLKKIKEKK